MAKKKKCCIPGENLNLFAVSAANVLARDLTVDEVAQLSAVFCVIGDALAVIATTRALCCDDVESDALPISQ